MSILRLPLEMIEAHHHVWHVGLFPSKFGVFMCCPAPTTGQMELSKTRVTVLFVSKVVWACHLFQPVFMYVILLCKVTGMDRLPHSHQLDFGAAYRFANVFSENDFQNLCLYVI